MEEKEQGLISGKQRLEHEGYTIESVENRTPPCLTLSVYLKGERMMIGKFSDTESVLEYVSPDRAPSYRTRKYIRDYAFTRLNQIKDQQ